LTSRVMESATTFSRKVYTAGIRSVARAALAGSLGIPPRLHGEVLD
jgi:hypothetical protein